MKLSRRRFLTISAAVAATPGGVFAQSWQGHAFGAEVSLTIRGPRNEAEAALSGARDLIFEIERLFSLYDPTSQLVRLNRLKILDQPDPRFLALMQKAGRAHSITGGLFDPTVQSLWKALAVGDVAEEARFPRRCYVPLPVGVVRARCRPGEEEKG